VRFLAFSPQAALALLAGVAALIVLAYLLRPRRRRVVVASNLIWRRVAAGSRMRRERWRWWLSLALALAIGLAIALALTRPEVAAIAGTARRVVLVIDDAPSMAARTRDGASRWQHALARARDVIASAGPASEFMVLDTMGQAAIPEFVVARDALAQLARLEPAVTGSARMPWLPAAADAALPHESLLLTDGVASLEVPAAIEVQSVFEPADNVAITAFEARAQPRDPTRYEALAQVLNASPVARHASIELSGAGGFAVTREFDVPAGQTVDAVFDVSAFAAGTLKARVRMQGDAFAADDEAYAVVGPHRARTVLLVTAGNPRLEQALKLLPGVALTVVKPADYTAGAQAESRMNDAAVPATRARSDEALQRAPDGYVFDGWAPPEAPPAGALVFGAPNVPGLGGAATEVDKPTIPQWDRAHPLTQDIAWRDLRIRRAGLVTVAGGADRAALVLARGSGEAALVRAGETSKRWIQVGFALRDSNLSDQAGFPVFLNRAIEWLDPRPEPLARGLGTVELPWAGSAVSDGEQRPVAVIATATGTRFEARSPGVYVARQGGLDRFVVVNALDAQRSEINRSRFAGAASARSAQPRRPPLSKVEPWLLLIAAAALLLVIEWLTFSRRWTV
jgi:hypothetical protein